MKKLHVALGERSYPIYIGSGLVDDGALLCRHIQGREVLVVTNETIAPLYLDRLQNSLSSGLSLTKLDSLILPDGEIHKNLDTLKLIYDHLLKNRHSRSTTLVALGGGVIGDMTGFAAATYQRGVNFVQVPTTLLSQVDSSVGGKTGVNHPLGKNMIGAFYQPVAVIADMGTLKTLPDREYRAGVAEVVKYGLIADPGFYVWLKEHVSDINGRDERVLMAMVERSCRNKADVVARDERESNIRAILNLGHTFGHAIETTEQYCGLLHGEAVAVGMLMAADLSSRLGWISASEVEDLRHLLLSLGLPTTVPAVMNSKAFLAAMSLDKKVADGVVRLVLLRALGDAVVTGDYAGAQLQETLDAFCP
ncbi:MAG: 3-dehydroquinate synthase [Porticoccaceae bacterium]|nr:3-dehydroquinate synthase [Porticoccaceae bacterium]